MMGAMDNLVKGAAGQAVTGIKEAAMQATAAVREAAMYAERM